jgi:hypothetical protein
MHGAALCCFSRENIVGCRGLLAVLWGNVVGLDALCSVQGATALMKAAEQGDEALLNQLIAVNANVCATNTNVIYCSCACVSHQSNSLRTKTCHIITLLSF